MLFGPSWKGWKRQKKRRQRPIFGRFSGREGRDPLSPRLLHPHLRQPKLILVFCCCVLLALFEVALGADSFPNAIFENPGFPNPGFRSREGIGAGAQEPRKWQRGIVGSAWKNCMNLAHSSYRNLVRLRVAIWIANRISLAIWRSRRCNSATLCKEVQIINRAILTCDLNERNSCDLGSAIWHH